MAKDLTNNQENMLPKLYSYKAFALGTFLGGPIAAGIMARKNFLKLGMIRHAWVALLTGILLSLFMIIAIVFLYPKYLNLWHGNFFHLAYTGISTLIVWIAQRDIIASHEENNGAFFSMYKAGWMGLTSLFLLYALLYISLRLTTLIFPSSAGWLQDQFDPDIYFESIEMCLQNENEALSYYPSLYNAEEQDILRITDSIMLPLITQNISILNELKGLKSKRIARYAQTLLLLDRNKVHTEKLELIRLSVINEDPIPWNELEELDSYISSLAVFLDNLEPVINGN